MADKYLYLEQNSNQLQDKEGVVVSLGEESGGRLIALNDEGKLDPSIVAGDIGTTTSAISSIAITAGSFVNIFSDAGIAKIRLASKTGELIAHGFVKSDYNADDEAVIYVKGNNDKCSGLTTGATYFLGESGQPTDTVPLGANETVQKLGIALNATSILFDTYLPVIRS